MGMNYYVISNSDKNKTCKIYDAYKDLYNSDILNVKIKKLLLKEFQPTIDVVSQFDDMKYAIENFEEDLDTTIRAFVSDIKYGVLDNFDLEEKLSVHIGKSSYGWLFNFQDQQTTLDNIEVIWHNYDDVKAWLTKYVKKKKMFTILDEEDRQITVDELFDLIDTKQKDPKNLSNPDNFTYSRNVNGYRFSAGDFS